MYANHKHSGIGLRFLNNIFNAYIYNCCIVVDMGTSAEPTNKPSSDNTCHLCGITFRNKDEKEEHIKLEHSEHKQPSGVS